MLEKVPPVMINALTTDGEGGEAAAATAAAAAPPSQLVGPKLRWAVDVGAPKIGAPSADDDAVWMYDISKFQNSADSHNLKSADELVELYVEWCVERASERASERGWASAEFVWLS